MADNAFYCAECEQPVIAQPSGELIRACEHATAAVVARMQARVVASGSFGQSTQAA